MTLHYRRKEVIVEEQNYGTKNQFNLNKSPQWVPDYLSFYFMKCEGEFTFWRKIHHGRNCGKCFCNDCCNFWKQIKYYGYTSPVSVFFDCNIELQLIFRNFYHLIWLLDILKQEAKCVIKTIHSMCRDGHLLITVEKVLTRNLTGRVEEFRMNDLETSGKDEI